MDEEVCSVFTDPAIHISLVITAIVVGIGAILFLLLCSAVLINIKVEEQVQVIDTGSKDMKTIIVDEFVSSIMQ